MLISYQQLASLPTPGEYNIKEKKSTIIKGKEEKEEGKKRVKKF